MPQRDLEIILMQRLANYLPIPVLLVGPSGNLLFYNAPAEALLGRRYEESGMISMKEWVTILPAIDEKGLPLPPEDRPLTIALQKRRAAHRTYWIRGFDGVYKKIEVTAFPLEGLAGRHLGAVAIFWETGSASDPPGDLRKA